MKFNMEEYKENFLNIVDITYSSSVDGEGFRDVVFVCYCPHHCEGCHNPETWNEKNGHKESIDEIFKKLTKSSLTNVTFSGGEPFCQAEALTKLAEHIKTHTKKTIWIYSGYTFEEIISDKKKKKLLCLCDVLVDGKFEKKYFKENIRFKGSENQRIIDIKKSMEEKSVILWNDDIDII